MNSVDTTPNQLPTPNQLLSGKLGERASFPLKGEPPLPDLVPLRMNANNKGLRPTEENLINMHWGELILRERPETKEEVLQKLVK